MHTDIDGFIVKYFNLIRTIIAILIGMSISVGIIILLVKAPGGSIVAFLVGPFSSVSRIGSILEKASPIILCGLAIAVSFQAGQFNLGAEGSLVLGACAGTAFSLAFGGPSWLQIPLTLIVAAVAGGLWCLIPGVLKAKLGADEVVVTLLMNYVAFYLAIYVVNYLIRDVNAGFMVSRTLPQSAWLQQFIPGTRVHWGIVLTFVLVGVVQYLMYSTSLGYEIRMTGHNLGFARYAGVNIVKIIVLSSLISGALAGIGGMTEIMGIHRRFNWQTSPGMGWDGVVVAIIGRNNPILLVFASLFLSYLRVGGQVLNISSSVPAETVNIIQSIIMILITAEAFMASWKNRVLIRRSLSAGGLK